MSGARGTADIARPDPPRAALEFTEVTARYAPDGPAAVADCSFRLAAGERVALIGPNGSGKTSVLRAAAGLMRHDGEIRVGGERLERARLEEIRAGIGFLFATPGDQILFPRVLDDVAFALRAGGGAGEEEAAGRAREVLERLGGEALAERSPFRLSHGERLLVALAGTLVARPPLLLLDEPTSGLDRRGRLRLRSAIEESEAALLLATHDLDFAASVCERYLCFDRGRLVRDADDPGDLDG
jgi:cobalt/nickel transport system ATP-binding protein